MGGALLIDKACAQYPKRAATASGAAPFT